MPVKNCNKDNLPEWSEVKKIKIIKLESGKSQELDPKANKSKLFICEGTCKINSCSSSKEYNAGKIIEFNYPIDFPLHLCAVTDSIIIDFAGEWSAESGDYGIFTLDKTDTPRNIGDITQYLRNTDFDNHYHDFDEYWIIYKGKGKVISEGRSYIVNAGDCVLTRMGDHHDFPEVYEKIYGVYFETTLKGKKRLGHLWKHTHL